MSAVNVWSMIVVGKEAVPKKMLGMSPYLGTLYIAVLLFTWRTMLMVLCLDTGMEGDGRKC